LGELGTPETDRLGYVYIYGGARLDVNNGRTLWGTYYSSPYGPNMVIGDKVIFWSFWSSSDRPNIIHCVDAVAGRTLWDFNPGSPPYEPVVYDDLLVFGASDGYLYALDLTDDSLAWKTPVDVDGWIGGNNLPADAKSLSDPSGSSMVVDNQTGLGVWGFTVTQRQIEGINGDNLYVGRLCTFDLSNGTVLSNYQVQSNCTLNSNDVGLAAGKDVFYVTAGLDVWFVDKVSGETTMLQRYEHSVSKPLLNDGTIFIAADHYLSAYR
jgi:outer membrane protein assembly factor BamB